MKKLILSIIILLASFSSFSQTGTITLSENQAKQVAKDLIAGDACKDELEQTKGILELTETKVGLKDKVINNLETQKSELLKIDALRIEQLEAKDKTIEAVEKQLKRQKRVSWLYKVTSAVGIVAGGYLLLR